MRPNSSASAPDHRLPMPALRDDNLRDYLAALGMLRIANQLWPEQNPKLAWDATSGTPALVTSAVLPEQWSDQVLQFLLHWQAAPTNPFGHGKIEGISQTQFRQLLIDHAHSPEADLTTLFYPSLAAQIPQDKVGRRSELIIESANRSVLKGVNDLLASTRNPPDFATDLADDGVLQVVSNTSRWHPAEYQSAALSATDPKDNKHRDPVSLNIAALFGLTFYPPVDTSSGRMTPGFRKQRRQKEFSWPVWAEARNPDCVLSMLHHPAVHEEPCAPDRLRQLGIHGLWRSRKFSPDGKNDYFSTAEPAL